MKRWVNGCLILLWIMMILGMVCTAVSAFNVTVPTDPIVRHINDDGINKTYTTYTSIHLPGEEGPTNSTLGLYDWPAGKFPVYFDTPGDYYINWKLCPQDMTGKVCDRPPMIDEDQPTVEFDNKTGPYLIGRQNIYPESDCCMRDMRLQDAVPTGFTYPSQGDWYVPYNGTRYYAEVHINSSPQVVWFDVDTTVKPDTYILHIQEKNYDPFNTGDYGAVNVPITIQYGKLIANFPQQMVYGDNTIKLEGNNTDSDTTYLWIKGQGLPKCGINLSPVDPDHPYRAFVSYGRENAGFWQVYQWDPSLLKIGPGSYEIWMSTVNPEDLEKDCPSCNPSKLTGVCAIQQCPTCGLNLSSLLMLTIPENNANVTPNSVERCCCPGIPCGTIGGSEQFWLQGKSQGDFADTYQNKTLQLWMFGDGMIGDRKFIMTEVPMLCDGTYKFDVNADILKPNGIQLCDMNPGKYYFLIQNPMYNKLFDVTLQTNAKGGILPAENNQMYVVSSSPVKWSKSFPIDGVNELRGTDALDALKLALQAPGIDDTYAEANFTLKDNPCGKSVDFTGEPLTGYAPLNVSFIGNSSFPVTSWKWEFGDGKTSSEQIVDHMYQDAGYYTVKLNGSDGITSRTNTKYTYIEVILPPVANFIYTPKVINSGDIVQFRDMSTGSPSTWNWEFGDGENSAMQSPDHVYKFGGNYTVKLSVGSLFGAGTSKEETIFVNGPDPNKIVADFGMNGISPLTVQFQDQSTGYPLPNSWNWEFGDGTNSTLQNPVHTYRENSPTMVTLTVSNGQSTDSITKNAGVVSNFGLNVISTRKIQFLDHSTGQPLPNSWLWEFGDGLTATIKDPIHVYHEDGETVVTLTVTNGAFTNTTHRIIGVR